MVCPFAIGKLRRLRLPLPTQSARITRSAITGARRRPEDNPGLLLRVTLCRSPPDPASHESVRMHPRIEVGAWDQVEAQDEGPDGSARSELVLRHATEC